MTGSSVDSCFKELGDTKPFIFLRESRCSRRPLCIELQMTGARQTSQFVQRRLEIPGAHSRDYKSVLQSRNVRKICFCQCLASMKSKKNESIATKTALSFKIQRMNSSQVHLGTPRCLIRKRSMFPMFQPVATQLRLHEDHVLLHCWGREHKHPGVVRWDSLGHKSSVMLTKIRMHLKRRKKCETCQLLNKTKTENVRST